MTYTIELNEVEERVLAQAAAARGVALDAYLREALREKADRDNAETTRREAVHAGYGKYAHVGLTPELRRQMKDEELRQEAASFGAAL